MKQDRVGQFYILKEWTKLTNGSGHASKFFLSRSLNDGRHRMRAGMAGSRAFHCVLILSLAHSQSFGPPPRAVLPVLSSLSLSLCSLTSLSTPISSLRSKLGTYVCGKQSKSMVEAKEEEVQAQPLCKGVRPRICLAPLHGGPLQAARPTPLMSSPWRAPSSAPMNPVPSLPLRPSPSHLSPLLTSPPPREEEGQGEANVRNNHW
jgi:hypothetical protein